MITSVLAGLALSSAITFVDAANDWAVPCISGRCFYDLLNPDGSVMATLNISGSPHAISDVTSAAGWTILGCDSGAEQQDLRLICTSTDPNGCNHLTDKGGPKDKIVRLPENCGKGPFARVVDLWVHDDQSVPPNVEAQLSRRHDSAPAVHGIRLDTNFSAIDSTRFGTVDFSISASSDANHNSTSKRQTGPFNQQGVFFPAVTQAPFVEFISTTIRCTGLDPDPFFSELQAIFDVSNVHVAMNVLIGVQGSMVPPTISSFAMTTVFGLDLSATLITGNVAVTGDAVAPRFRALQTPLTGLSFPGILDINPSFFMDVSFFGRMQVGMTTRLGLEYHAQNAVLTFPPLKGGSAATFSPGNFPIQYTVGLSGPNTIPLIDSVNYHLIPGISFGLSAFGGSVTSAIVLSLDAAGETTMEVLPPTDGSNEINPIFDAIVGITASATATSGFFSLFDSSTAVTLGSQAFFIPTQTNELPVRKRDLIVNNTLSRNVSLEKRQSSLSCVQHPPASHTVFSTMFPSNRLQPCGTVDNCF
ncbi:hypothetical protein HGRIS_012271 [Hohenbuehelia grisea]|uniref:Uncharacterized protein n=1 Tax=Hohenbuehelia grisea TaxID=104357 RepID=A0ABR3IRS1_9AGAR